MICGLGQTGLGYADDNGDVIINHVKHRLTLTIASVG